MVLQDGPTDRWITAGRTDGRVRSGKEDGRTERQTDRRTNAHGPTDRCTDGPTDRPIDQETGRPTDRPRQGMAGPAPTLPRPHRMSDDDGDFHSPLPSSDSRATSPSSRTEWESCSAATTEEVRSNGNRSHVEYEHQSGDSAAEGDPWWTALDEATLQELFETSPRESMEFRAASEAGSTSSESVEDAADAMQRLSMTVPPWAPIVQMPEIPEDQRHTRDAAGHCKICGPDLYHMCLPMSQPTKCPLRKHW